MTPLKNWKEEGGVIKKEFTFSSFSEALGFVNKVGALAEKADHHPDIRLHDYKHVTIMLTTHSANRVTEKDRSFARAIDAKNASNV